MWTRNCSLLWGRFENKISNKCLKNSKWFEKLNPFSQKKKKKYRYLPKKSVQNIKLLIAIFGESWNKQCYALRNSWKFVISVWYNKKCIFGLCPILLTLSSWHRASKTLGISWVIGISFVIHNKLLSTTPEFKLIRWLLMGPKMASGWGLIAGWSSPVIIRLELTVPSAGKGRGAGDWVKSWTPKGDLFIHADIMKPPPNA